MPRPSRPRRRYKPHELAAIAARHGAACVRCGRPVDLDRRGTDPDGPTVDHYPIPWADGGPDNLDNWRLAHSSCNKAAGRKPPTTMGPTSRKWL